MHNAKQTGPEKQFQIYQIIKTINKQKNERVLNALRGKDQLIYKTRAIRTTSKFPGRL